MEERRGRFLESLGTVEGILSEHRGDSQGANPCGLPSGGRLLINLLDQGGDSPALLFDRQVAPTGKGAWRVEKTLSLDSEPDRPRHPLRTAPDAIGG